ncbi:MAG: tRNA (adenosine(37)-N6)-dimethylallyltransferase MiaA [Candidatus Azosocius agrarius]|nr:MAG: tRNA (adenosine(37)-N6)-dimethylallyltransferase MiaA [Gammaproteobacteria bacterium]
MFNLKNKIYFLMGITASGKTDYALQFAKFYRFEIISFDSVMIYKNFNIGSNKPNNNDLLYKPHYFMDLLHPNTIYTISDFYNESVNLIFDIFSRNNFPLFVGGSMMYFLSLEKGLAFLPNCNLFIRNKLLYLVDEFGWNFIYYKIKIFNNNKLMKFKLKDKFRLLRLIEILILTGSLINNFEFLSKYYVLKNLDIVKFSLFINKLFLFKKIENRIYKMMNLGFINEMKYLYNKIDINKNCSSVKSIGYKQIYDYLSGKITFNEMLLDIVLKTKKLVKNQITWLKFNNNIIYLNNKNLFNSKFHYVFNYIKFKDF